MPNTFECILWAFPWPCNKDIALYQVISTTPIYWNSVLYFTMKWSYIWISSKWVIWHSTVHCMTEFPGHWIIFLNSICGHVWRYIFIFVHTRQYIEHIYFDVHVIWCNVFSHKIVVAVAYTPLSSTINYVYMAWRGTQLSKNRIL